MTQMSQREKEGQRDPRTYAIIGAAMEVHRTLGRGFLEPVYQAALALEFTKREIPFDREVSLAVTYHGQPLDVCYRADFICFNSVIVELKAVRAVTAVEEAQVINYLKATELEVALLLNFCAASLEYRRFVMTKRESAQSAVKEMTCRT